MVKKPDNPYAELQEEIKHLARERNAVIIAHNYERAEVQDVADFVGDSLGLSREAAKTKADVIVFCGVHFMAETAAILSPQKTVLLPDLAAGCSLAATIDADQLRDWKAEHPGAVVVSYVNTTAAVKAESDYCCTSGNAVEIVNSVPAEKEVLFLPDMFLGAHVRRVSGRKNMHVWMGECHVHAGIDPEDIRLQRAAHPGAEFLIHPECGCATSVVEAVSAGDIDPVGVQILSTEGMIKRPKNSPNDEFIIATEVGILHRLRRENPNKTFYPANPEAVCAFMKVTTLPKVLRSLERMEHRITVPPEIAARARLAIERMVAIGGQTPLSPAPAAGVSRRMIKRGESELAAHGFAWEEGLHFPLTKNETTAIVAAALQEDDTKHDITTAATVKSNRRARCRLVARQAGVIAGLPLACEAFLQLDPAVTMRIEHEDGARVSPQTPAMFLSGHAVGLLSAERVALNFVQRLSGIATLTARYVEAVAGTGAHILDTRKTTPLWRRLEKYAVRAGGGLNHRMDLSSAVLIKDNHLAAVDGDIAVAVSRARAVAPLGIKLEVECDRLDQVRAAIDAGADIIMLDNMQLMDLREAVKLVDGRAVTEASGGVTLDTVRFIAETGVDWISVGALTHSAPALDLALDFD